MTQYGTWASPITTDMIVGQTIELSQPTIQDGAVYWLESRPNEKGRTTLMRWQDSATHEVTPQHNVRSKVHEYGGGAYAIHQSRAVFTHFATQHIHHTPVAGFMDELLVQSNNTRFADFCWDAKRQRWLCVCENHDAGGEPINTLVAIGADGSTTTLAQGADFYSTPRIHPNGHMLTYLAWHHPNMPWDGTELWLADIADDGAPLNSRLVAGGKDESIFQPEWSPTGELYFVSDKSGWWNLYRLRFGKVEPMCNMTAEFGQPQWNFANNTYGFIRDNKIICKFKDKRGEHLALLNVNTKALREIETPYKSFGYSLRAEHGKVVFVGASPTRPSAVVLFDDATRTFTELKQASDAAIDAGYLSQPKLIEFPTEDGKTAFAYFYAPQNKDYAPPDAAQALPPLIVKSHGGPTSAAQTNLSLKTQFWTSRGFAVLDVDYGGSTGYGRDYRQRLNGNWGIVDVDDCVNGAAFLVAQGLVDGARLIITGGSAGGYTALAALTFRNTVFKIGSSHYGISDMEALAKDTHKFESRYCDNLVAPYPAQREIYMQRSPIYFTHQLNAAMILFQGADDKVVLPNQSQKMFEAVRAKELPVVYMEYAGEGHGFRQAGNIKRTLEAELYFYGRVLGFTPADVVEPIVIENLD